MDIINDILGKNGSFSKNLSGFAPRIQQQEMAVAIEQVLQSSEIFIAEAGTGTGKTYAYLVPAMLSGRKIIISTGTKNLQDQLFYKDVPIVKDALAIPVTVALLKGRANYVCHHFLSITESEGRFSRRGDSEKILKIRNWCSLSRTGDKSECTALTEDDIIWSRVTSTTENCLGQECPDFSDCFLIKARRQAQAADIVIINHHLLFSDMAIKEEGFGELLPSCDAYIIDEAHQLPDIASNFFGISISSNQLNSLARDTHLEYLKEINEDNDIADCTHDLKKNVADLRIAMGRLSQRVPWKELLEKNIVADALRKMHIQLEELHSLLESLAERTKGLDACFRRCTSFIKRLDTIIETDIDEYIRWCDVRRKQFSIHMTPLSIAEHFQSQIEKFNGSWIFTSATLAVGSSFEHFSKSLGIENAQQQQWDSPFDYKNQSLLYLPTDLPQPNTWKYNSAVIKLAEQIFTITLGRAFFLFTSYKSLTEAAEVLRKTLKFPLFIQGDAPRDALLEQFREAGNAVLLGTSSFWEGVDVRGEALSCVIIDKLPFASIADPVLKARIDTMRANGTNPFMNHQLPNAVITLKQGAGRLIRDVNDRGLLVLCDPRLQAKPYGRIFLSSLPNMPKTTKLEDVKFFFNKTTSPIENIS